MRKLYKGSLVGLVVFLAASSWLPLAHADSPAPSLPLAMRQIKISGDEFVVVQNTSGADLPLSEYWLGYSSSDTATNIVPTAQLPDVTLPADGVVLLNNGSAETCDASLVTSLAFSSLSDSKGTLELRHLVNTGETSSFTTIQRVNWGKADADMIQIANEGSLPEDANAVWYKDAGNYASVWQLGDYQNCTLTVTNFTTLPAPPEPTVTWLPAASSPPSVIVRTVVITDNRTGSAHIPASDIGLKALQLSEILPNPASPQTDTDDEFIELYNPNGAAFDLSAFQLQIGSTTSSTIHSYTFPDGTVLPPQSFKAFKSETTHLSLNNSGGQVWLVDPLDHTVTQSDVYGAAKDGQSWVNADGKWQWTLQATPDAANKIAAPAGSASTKTATVNGRNVAAVKGATTNSASGNLAAGSAQSVAQVTPVHPLTLVLVVLAALLYGAYEYRQDLANRLYEYRRYRAARQTPRR
jgi:hypothetical protein